MIDDNNTYDEEFKDVFDGLNKFRAGGMKLPEKAVYRRLIEEYCNKYDILPGASWTRPIADEIREFKVVSVEDLLNEEVSEFPYLVDKLVPERAITSITADSGKGKSLIALKIAGCVASGDRLFGEFNTKKTKVLYVDQEMDKDLVTGRVQAIIGKQAGIKPSIDFLIEQFWEIDKDEDFEFMKEYIIKNGCGLIILDTLSTVHGKDENSSTEMREINQRMLKLINETGVTIIYLHHHRKLSKGEKYGQSTSRGSTEIIAKVASHLLIDSKAGRTEEGFTLIAATISQEKSRRPDGINKISVDIIYNPENKLTEYIYKGEVDSMSETVKNAEAFILDILNSDPSQRSIANFVDNAKLKNPDIKEGAIRIACAYLCQMNLISMKKGKDIEGIPGKYWNTNYYFIDG